MAYIKVIYVRKNFFKQHLERRKNGLQDGTKQCMIYFILLREIRVEVNFYYFVQNSPALR